MSVTTIRIDTKTRERLKHICMKDETYNDKINEFIDKIEYGDYQ